MVLENQAQVLPKECPLRPGYESKKTCSAPITEEYIIRPTDSELKIMGDLMAQAVIDRQPGNNKLSAPEQEPAKTVDPKTTDPKGVDPKAAPAQDPKANPEPKPAEQPAKPAEQKPAEPTVATPPPPPAPPPPPQPLKNNWASNLSGIGSGANDGKSATDVPPPKKDGLGVNTQSQ
jgi:outer membrane biosynthesis protein TonB